MLDDALQKFAPLMDECTNSIKTLFREGLEHQCQAGANKAAQAAVEVLEAFSTSMHWQSYRAAIRRNGAWRRDLNEELLQPMVEHIASEWGKVGMGILH
jgi:hypothetical protein